MKNYLIKYPKGLKLLIHRWTNLKEPNLIRSSFNADLYLDYLHAIKQQPNKG